MKINNRTNEKWKADIKKLLLSMTPNIGIIAFQHDASLNMVCEYRNLILQAIMTFGDFKLQIE